MAKGFKEVTYRKDGPKGPEIKVYEILTLNNAETYFEGISIGDFTPDEKEKVKAIFEQFQKDIEPFYKKGYRRLNRASVIQEKAIE